jgi:hypothetical protein
LRDVDRAKRAVSHFRSFIGKKKLRSIIYGDVASYKRMRMATPAVHNRQRNIATMNRELVVLRRMFNIGLAESWILRILLIAESLLLLRLTKESVKEI